MNDPTGIAFDPAGNLWVANYKGNSLLMYSHDRLGQGGPVRANRSIVGAATKLRGPNRLAFDTAGNLWVVDYDSNTIAAFAAADLAKGGEVPPRVAITASGIDQPTGLAFDAAGNLWVTNQGNGSVIEFAARDLTKTVAPGPVVTLTMTKGKGAVPEAIAFDAAGELWVALFGDNQLAGFPPSSFQTSGSPLPSAQIHSDRPIGVTFDRGGRLWVTESMAVKAFDLAHASTPLVTVTWASMLHPHTPAFDGSGDLWFSSQNDSLARIAGSQLSSPEVNSPSAVITSRA
jgi:sugar lactone lactonase YvrE